MLDPSVGDEVHRPVDVSQTGHPQRQLLDLPSRLLVDLDDVADTILILEQNEEAVDDVLHEILGTEAHCKSDDPYSRQERGEVIAKAG
jgi:hypothetical protein